MPIEISCDQCQSHYHLKDEHAGKKVRCKKCSEVFGVPEKKGSATAEGGR